MHKMEVNLNTKGSFILNSSNVAAIQTTLPLLSIVANLKTKANKLSGTQLFE